MLENLNMDEIRKITQANDFIESPFSQEFTASELKIFEGLTAECIQDDINLYKSKQNKVVRFTTKHLSSLLNTSISSISHEAERISKSLATKHIHARKVSENGQVEFVTIGIIPFASYIDGIFEVELNYKLIPYFINIDRPYTQFYLHNISVLKSAYAIKLYKLLYQYKNIKYRKFLIEELRKQFGITDKYQLYGSFKQIVIETSIKQINEKTDLDVEYTEIKVGRKVESLEFRFHLKKKQSIKSGNIKSEIIDVEPIERSDVLLVNSTDYSSIDVLLGHRADDISSKTKDLIVKLLVDRGEIFVECSIDYAKKNAKSNFEKYLLDTIENNWAKIDIQKLESKRSVEEMEKQKKQAELEAKNKELELENANKSEIEHLFLKLSDPEQIKYSRLATNIMNKYTSKLKHTTIELLSYSIFAVSNDRYYDKKIEVYVSKFLNISLNINDYLL